ncbi:efflux RND transporter permease subunit [Gorillibacterium massiliense]|uniref:efflux RND transporter permease subunit n=1 Tax=Gorillibacterium massiliense TaxID=1280390 RepID=UPI0004ADD02B|nr:efflux RND transporter permease subunit [Gorillibacterium massiliense]
MSLFTKWGFKNKAAVGLLVIMALAVGILSYFQLPMELLPSADNPQVTVTAIGPGYDARSMEREVSTPLESALGAIKGKKEMLSESGDGYAQINLFFESKTDMKQAKADVQEAVGQVQLPQGVIKPYVLQLNTSMIPVSELSVVYADGLSDTERESLGKTISYELNKIDGVGSALIFGKAVPGISVAADTSKLAQKGIAPQVLMGLLQGKDSSLTVGEKAIDGAMANLKVSSSVEGIDALRNLPVAPGVKLADVAQVKLSAGQESVTRLNGKESLVVDITKEANANSVKVGKEVKKTVDRINKDYEGKVKLDVFFSTTDMVVHSVNSMMREVLMGALFATIVILLFLRNIRTTLITIVSIPLSLGITLYLLNLSGVTLNIITLGGVAVAVGRLVDDSIVVIENIYRRLQKESFSAGLIIDATREVSSAITSSTITTVAVFLPIGLLKGSLQAFLLPFALTVTYSLLASLIVALTVVPLLSSLLLRRTRTKEHRGSARFAGILGWNLKHKWVPLVVATLLFFGSIASYMAMPKGAIDSSDYSLISASLNFPSDTPISKVLDEGKKLEAYLIDQPESKYTFMQNGNSSDSAAWGNVVSPTLVDYIMVLKDGKDGKAFIEKVKKQKDQFPDAEFTVSAMNLMGGGTTSVTVDIVGEDAKAIDGTAADAMKKIAAIEGVTKVTSNMEETKPVYNVKVKPEAGNAQEIGAQLQGMMNSIPLGKITDGGKDVAVNLEPLITPASVGDLNKLTVSTAAGVVPVSQVAQIVKVDEPSLLYHKDAKPYVRITASADAKKLSVVAADIKKEMDKITLPANTDLVIGGASAEQSDNFSDLYTTALVSIGLVFLILVVTFKTFRAPFAIILSLPLAAIGSVVGLIIAGITPDYTAAFGALMLIGIVVTNAIVLIDRVRHNEEKMPIREALIEAASVRMRPILMTAIATICAMLPLLFGKAEMGSIVSQSLAIVVIGGLVVATVLTLIVIPCVYELFYFRKAAKQRKAAVGETSSETLVAAAASVEA